MEKTVDLTKICEKIYQKVLQEVVEASQSNSINEILKKYGLEDEVEYSYYDINNSKILIVGDSRVSKDDRIRVGLYKIT